MYECVNVSENVLCVCGVCVVCVVCVVGRRINKQNGRIERERERRTYALACIFTAST